MKEIEIKNKTAVELKALAYDKVVLLEHLQREIQEINKIIKSLTKVEEKASQESSSK